MRKYVLYAVVFLQVLLVVSLSRGLFETVQSRQRISDLKEKKEKLISERERLQSELSYVESDYYIESVAREKLHLTKPGETLVLVDPGVITQVLDDGKQQEESVPIWRRWAEVLFGSE